MNIKRLHYYSGLTLSVFILLHLFNHSFSLAGADEHIDLMNTLRRVYRNPFAETILLLAVLLQILSGLKLFFGTRKSTPGFFRRLQLWSGFYLALFLLFHVGAVFIGRLVLHVDTNFYFGVAGLNIFPLNLFFIPYYGLAILSFFAHIAALHAQKMRKSILGANPALQAYTILTIGFLIMLVLFYGFTDGFRGVNIPAEYHLLPVK